MNIHLTEKISKRLRKMRLTRGFKSLKNFAKFHHIPISTYSQHETGKRSISAELILHYSNLLNINPYWLLTGKGEVDDVDSIDNEGNEYSSIGNIYSNQSSIRENKELLKEILLSAERLFYDSSIQLTHEELIDHCLDIFDIVSLLSIELKEKKKIIELSINSIKLGTINNSKQHLVK